MKSVTSYLRIFLLITSAALMTACGSSKQGNDYDFSSRLAGGSIGNVDTNTRPLAYCNHAENGSVGINTGVFKDGDYILNEKIYLKLTKIPSYFSQGQNYIQFWKWLANPQGNSDIAASPLKFHIQAVANGQYLTTASKTSLYWNDLQYIAQAVQASSAQDLFNKIRLVIDLEDPYADYDVIRTTYYNMDNSVFTELDSLIPIFDADPMRYATEANGQPRAQILQSLHPFATSIGKGWTNSYYQTKSNEFCAPLDKTTN